MGAGRLTFLGAFLLVASCSGGDSSEPAADAAEGAGLDGATAQDAGNASNDGGGSSDAGGGIPADCSDCPVCSDGEIKLQGSVDGTDIDLALEIFSYSHDAVPGIITVRVREGNDFADTFVVDYARTSPDIRGKTFPTRGSLDLSLNASTATSSCADDGRNGLVSFSALGDREAQFILTDFRAPSDAACEAAQIPGIVRGCWND